MRLRSDSSSSSTLKPSTVKPLTCFQKLSRHSTSHCQGTCTVAAYGIRTTSASASAAGSATPPAPSSHFQPRSGAAGAGAAGELREQRTARAADRGGAGARRERLDRAAAGGDRLAELSARDAGAVADRGRRRPGEHALLLGLRPRRAGAQRSASSCHGQMRRSRMTPSCSRPSSGQGPSAMRADEPAAPRDDLAIDAVAPGSATRARGRGALPR